MEAITERICRICSQIGDFERGSQKGGREQEDTFLPAAADELALVRDLSSPGIALPEIGVNVPSSRLRQLRACPACGTFYIYFTDYEFLYGGSEDEQILDRLTPMEAYRVLRILEFGPESPDQSS